MQATSPIAPLADSRSSRSRWYWRIPIKLAIFTGVTLLVLFPYPAQLRRHFSHIKNMQAMVQPDAPELTAWDDELRAMEKRVSAGYTARISRPDDDVLKGVLHRQSRDIQKEVERFVLERVEYEWDWNVWGSADYMPTVAEMFEQARNNGGQMLEDCDGRAVMAASILRRMGYDAQLVTDLRHVWVKTPEQELMGPGGKKALVTTTQGTRVDILSALVDVPIALSYGVAVFPLWRELIIAAAAVLLMAWRRVPVLLSLFAALLVLQGLLFMRLGFIAPRHVSGEVHAWPSWLGIAHLIAGLGLLFISSMRRRRT